MEKLYDESYVNTYGSDMYQYGDYKLHVPTSRRYGWTAFCEPDELLRQAGITGNTREEILVSLENYARTYYVLRIWVIIGARRIRYMFRRLSLAEPSDGHE